MFLQEEQHQEAFIAEKKVNVNWYTSQNLRVLKMTHQATMSGMPGYYQLSGLGVRLYS